MQENTPKVMSWGAIIGILLAAGFVIGLTIGTLGTALGIPVKGAGAGMGAGVGLLAVVLIQRRRAALLQQQQQQNKS